MRVEWWQYGEGLRHGWLAWRCRCLSKKWELLVVKVLAEKIGI